MPGYLKWLTVVCLVSMLPLILPKTTPSWEAPEGSSSLGGLDGEEEVSESQVLINTTGVTPKGSGLTNWNRTLWKLWGRFQSLNVSEVKLVSNTTQIKSFWHYDTVFCSAAMFMPNVSFVLWRDHQEVYQVIRVIPQTEFKSLRLVVHRIPDNTTVTCVAVNATTAWRSQVTMLPAYHACYVYVSVYDCKLLVKMTECFPRPNVTCPNCTAIQHKTLEGFYNTYISWPSDFHLTRTPMNFSVRGSAPGDMDFSYHLSDLRCSVPEPAELQQEKTAIVYFVLALVGLVVVAGLIIWLQCTCWRAICHCCGPRLPDYDCVVEEPSVYYVDDEFDSGDDVVVLEQ